MVKIVVFSKKMGAQTQLLWIYGSGYLKKETAVVSIVLPFVYHGVTNYAVFLKNLHRK